MKCKNFSFIIILFITVWLTGCREITTNTTIYSDGSCDRQIQVAGDSSALLDYTYFPVPDDSTWDISQHHELGKDSDYRYTARKHFPRISDLNEELTASRSDTLQVGVQVEFDKHFRWFNTFYTYREKYFKSNPFEYYPVSDFLSEEEVKMYLIDDDTLDLGERIDFWMEKNIFEAFFQGLLDACKLIKESSLTEENLTKNKERLYHAIKETEFSGDFPFEEQNVKEIMILMEKVMGNKRVWKLEGILGAQLSELNKQYDFITTIHFDRFKNHVTMPGLIISANAQTIEGNRASWEFRGTALIFDDYIMQVKSRIMNPWAVWVSGGIVCLIIIFLIVSSVHKRQI